MAQSAYEKEQIVHMVKRAVHHASAGTTDSTDEIYRLPVESYSPRSWDEEMNAIFRRLPLMLGLSTEMRVAGDYKAMKVLNVPVLMVRGEDMTMRAFINACRHRGRAVTQTHEESGHVRSFVCPYHQWAYKLNGDLAGLPFKNGVKDGDSVNGGMPADFDVKDHGLTKLRVAVLHGLVFATFSDAAESLEDYLGPDILPWIDRIFKGRDGPRKLTLLGYNRQRIPGNWKLMMENIKDPYHPGLLHTWFVTFGLWRADQKSRMVMDSEGRHAVMISRRNEGGENAAVTKGVTSFKANMALHDDRLLDVVSEPWWTIPDPARPGESITPTVTMITLFPSLIIQQ